MKHLTKIMSVILVITSIYGFKQADKKQKGKNAVDWNGVYKGKQTTEGKEMTFVLYLNADHTYSLQSIGEKESIPTISNGSLTWNKAGDQVTLVNAKTKNKMVYRLQEKVLEKIKEKGKPIAETEVHKLQKIDFQEITEKYWKLIEIRGKSLNETNPPEAYIMLEKDKNRIKGSGGCNTFSGHYEIEQAKQIKISKVAATKKACLNTNTETETELFKTLQMVDNYTISKDGRFLSFNKGNMPALARFEVVYLK